MGGLCMGFPFVLVVPESGTIEPDFVLLPFKRHHDGVLVDRFPQCPLQLEREILGHLKLFEPEVDFAVIEAGLRPVAKRCLKRQVHGAGRRLVVGKLAAEHFQKAVVGKLSDFVVSVIVLLVDVAGGVKVQKERGAGIIPASPRLFFCVFPCHQVRVKVQVLPHQPVDDQQWFAGIFFLFGSVALLAQELINRRMPFEHDVRLLQL